jgi:hypothetical protein
LKQPYKRLTTKERLRSKKVYEFIGKGLLSIREVLFFVDFTSLLTIPYGFSRRHISSIRVQSGR